MNKLLKDILEEEMREKNITASKIIQETEIAERYINAFLKGEKDKLPPAPYVRGYLKRIAASLSLDHDYLWKIFLSETTLKRSGASDMLPKNRFALKKINKKLFVYAMIAAILMIYGAMNAGRFLGLPKIDIENPLSGTIVTTANIITLKGVVGERNKLFINGEETIIGSDGRFEEKFELIPGLNNIEFSVTKLLGREITVSRQVIYQPETKAPESFFIQPTQ